MVKVFSSHQLNSTAWITDGAITEQARGFVADEVRTLAKRTQTQPLKFKIRSKDCNCVQEKQSM